jgi:hypothetical protein
MIGITLRISVQRIDIRNDKKCAMKKGKREIRKENHSFPSGVEVKNG